MSRYEYDPTTEELTLIAGNSYQKFIAPIESSPTKTSHAKGSYLIYGSVLYEVTTAISSGGNIVVYPTSGYNVKVAATLEEQIASLSSALTTYENVCGAKNLVPNYEKTQVINGVTITVNADGSVSMSGTANADFNFYTASNFTGLVDGDYVLSGCPSGGDYNSGYSLIAYSNSKNATRARDLGEGAEFTYSKASHVNISVCIRVISGTNMTGKVFYPMLRLVGTDSTYVPYAMTNRELTDEIVNPRCTIGARTTIATTSSASPFTCPSDGYVFVYNSGSNTGSLRFALDGNISIGGNAGRYSTYVKKGTEVWVDGTCDLTAFCPLQ